MTMEHGSNNLLVYILPVVFGVCVLILLAAWFIRRRKKARSDDMNCMLQEETGNLLPLVEYQETISYGNFGCVKKAYYQSQLAAIKCLNSQGFHVWDNEKKLYSMFEINHENIVKFIAAEKRIENKAVQYWIVTEYCQEGSLFNFLHSTTLSFKMLLNASIGISNGLAFLHSENKHSTPVKPAIAHFDLKSKNVLVKDKTATCCISDFGLATVLQNNGNKTQRMQVGTPRYMAPELLEGVMSNQENDILAVDTYALALVMWELISRCHAFQGLVEDYAAPFHEYVGATPSVEDMRVCVVENKNRPAIKQHWKDQPLLKEYVQNIEESWDSDSDARLTAECIYERLKRLFLQYNEQYPGGECDIPQQPDSSSSSSLPVSSSENQHQSLQDVSTITDTPKRYDRTSDMTV